VKRLHHDIVRRQNPDDFADALGKSREQLMSLRANSEQVHRQDILF